MKLNIKQIILWICINAFILTLVILGYYTYEQYYSLDPLSKLSPKEYGLLALFGSSVSLFALVGISLFSTGWKSYEAKYVKGAEESLDSMFLTIPPQHVLYISVLSALFFGGILGLLTGAFVVGIIFGAVAFFFPKLILKFAKAKRDLRFQIQLVDALTSMTNSLKAGFSLQQAFDLIEREMGQPISQEFRLVNYETRIGVPLNEALDHLFERMPSEDLDLVVTAINISQEIGGNLTEVFDNIARTIRERRIIEGKIRALTAQGKMQGMVMCALPLVLGFIINLIMPDLMEPLYTTPAGYVLIGVVVVFEIIGALIIRKIVSIEV